MSKLSLTLIAAIAALTLSTVPAAGQFSIPKIKIPKIPSKDSAPSSPERSAAQEPSSISTTSSGEVRGTPISGARITFSNNTDGSNPKNSFTSSEFIYGHLDLGGKTVYEAFNLKNQKDVPYYYINYDVVIYKPGQKPYEGNWGGAFNQTLVSKEDAQKTYWNFDVLPDPAKISTIKSMLANEKDFSKKSVAGIYSKWYNADSARSTFPQNGTYIIDVTVWGDSYDDWGKTTFETEKKPTASAMFSFQFSGADGQTLVANAEKASKALEAAKNASEMYRTMPDFWAKGISAPDPKLAPARLVPMIKSYIGQWNLTYMKHMIYPLNGPAWAIEKNDLGIPRYRRFTSAIYIIYKDPKENSCQIGYLEMHEPYAGGGTYSGPVLNGISDVKYIDCAVVR
jgi:hypothetical protein